MKHSEEEQKYMADMKRAFEEQKDVQLRELSMTKERYQQLAYTYCKITDEEEMKDFAFISTHDTVRDYYLADTNFSLLEQLKRIASKKHPLERCITDGRLFVNANFPHSIKIDNLRELKEPPLTTPIVIANILSGLSLSILKWLSIFLIARLLSLPLAEIASAYLAAHPL